MSDTDQLQLQAEAVIDRLDELAEAWCVLRTGRTARETAEALGEVVGLDPATVCALVADDQPDDPTPPRPRRRRARPRQCRGDVGRSGVERRGARARKATSEHLSSLPKEN